MKAHPQVQEKYNAIYNEMSPLVTAMIVAAVACARVDVINIETGAVKPMDDDKLTQEQRNVIEMAAHANTEFANGLQELLTATAQLLTATQALPRTIAEGCTQVAAFQLDYEAAASQAQEKIEAWRSLDVQSSRTKVAVAKRLQEGGMARTAAEAAASGDPEYTTLKDAIAAALSEKEAAEIERDVCLSKLITARLLLQGQIQMSVAKIGAPTVILREEAKAPTQDRKGDPLPDGSAGATAAAGQG